MKDPLAERFAAVVQRFANAPAVSDEEHTVTFAELSQRVEDLARSLRSRPTGAVILLALPGGPWFTAVHLAGLLTGAVVVPIPAETTADEARRFVEMVEPDIAVVLDPQQALMSALPAHTERWCARAGARPDLAEHTVLLGDLARSGTPHSSANAERRAPWPKDTAMVQFTSGSTGRPKGIVLGRSNLLAHLDLQRSFLEPLAGREVFCPMPQAHAYGNTVVLEHLFHGVGVHLANRFVPATDLRRLRDRSCTGILAAPTYFRLLLGLGGMKKEQLPDLRFVTMGTAAAGLELCRDLRAQRPDLTIYLRYGLTETMGPVARLELRPERALPESGAVGRVIEGLEVRVPSGEAGRLDPDEVRVRGDIVALGQLTEPGRFQPLLDAEGYFPTGDLGYRDDAGELHLRGRISSFLKRNGYRINPFEIEDVLRAVPGVVDAAVVGRPDEVAGQRVVAFVQRSVPGPALEPAVLLAECRRRLSAFKVPQECVVLDALPRTASGKPDRTRLAQGIVESGTPPGSERR